MRIALIASVAAFIVCVSFSMYEIVDNSRSQYLSLEAAKADCEEVHQTTCELSAFYYPVDTVYE